MYRTPGDIFLRRYILKNPLLLLRKGVGDMVSLNIPKGRSDFETIRREGFYYVDKTGLIGEI